MAKAKPKGKGKQELVKVINLKIAPGAANPAPPVGPALGQAGLNIKEFCDQYNKMSAQIKPIVAGAKLSVKINVFSDKTFQILIGGFPTTDYLRLKSGIKKGSKTPGTDIVAKILMSDIKEIAKEKMSNMNTNDLDAAVQMVIGTALSMGLEVKEG